VVQVPDVNAFTFLGGHIIVTRGLLEKVKTPAELAGVIAHEMGHLSERHVLASIIRASFMTSIWTVAFGDISGLLVIDPSTLKQILELRHGREMEERADRFALDTLRAAGIAPKGMHDFFDTLMKEEGHLPQGLAFLSTHPLSVERKKVVARFAQAHPELIDEMAGLSAEEWFLLKRMCR